MMFDQNYHQIKKTKSLLHLNQLTNQMMIIVMNMNLEMILKKKKEEKRNY